MKSDDLTLIQLLIVRHTIKFQHKMAIVETLLYKSPDLRDEESWYMMQDSDTGKVHFEKEWDNLSYRFEVSQGRREVKFDELPQKAKDKFKSL